MAEQIGYNFIINMLLSPSAKMQYVGKLFSMYKSTQYGILEIRHFLAFFFKPGGEAVIALSKDSRIHQNQICEGNGIAPLIRLLRISKLAEGTLLSVIRAVGSMCIGL